ncbi:MAG: hypothetical protein P1U47_03590 [Zhongshania sp.]|uniref:hypothetical protein n=1 Tax=Zhongshania sp. TaxID=1971902 RepID=UPI0026385BD1|nr:hypothetical protein [Zhongshania sp.]MDF1691430.1 hypothetical protein [Zhongshania sp.]
MSTEYLIYAILILLSRLVYLRNDGPLSRRANLLLSAVQGLAVLLVFTWNTAGMASLFAVVLVALVNLGLERRLDLSKGYRLITLFILLLLPDYAASFGDRFELQPWVLTVSAHLQSHLSILQWPRYTGADQIGLIVFGLLILANEVNILLRAVFHHCHLEPKPAAADRVDGAIDNAEYNAGRVIGFLERWLMFMIIFQTGEFSALAFIIAAKGLARMKQLEDKQFAEYMLIGTFVSALAAIIVGSSLAAI